MRTKMLAVTVCLLFAVTGVGTQSRVSLEGVWKIAERITPGSHPRAKGVEVRQNTPRPNLQIFTKRYYSELLETGGAPRPEVAAPADSQKLTDHLLRIRARMRLLDRF